MRAEKPSIDVAEGTSAAFVGTGALVLAFFPLAIPLIALTAVALIPLLVPVLAAALVGAVVAAPVLLVRRLGRRSRASVAGQRSENDLGGSGRIGDDRVIASVRTTLAASR
jgi:membrane protein implicated in regulation of membrane protease activity